MTSLPILTSLLFLGILGYFGWNSFRHRENFIRTYSRNSIFTIISSFLFFLSIICVLLANLRIVDFGVGSDTIIRGGDIIFTIDVSKSMDARDISAGNNEVISRLDTVKKFLLDSIGNHPENRYGIILFAGKALISSPLTTDKDVLANIISSLSSKAIREGGTNLEDAISLSIGRFSHTNTGSTDTESRTIVLLSDGGESDDIASWEHINELIIQAKNIQISVAGFGTKEGSTIPLGRDVFGNTINKTQDGREIISALGTENLERIASIANTQTEYYDSIDQEATFDKKLSEGLRTNLRKLHQENSDDSTRILLFLSSLLLLASLLTIRTKQ